MENDPKQISLRQIHREALGSRTRGESQERGDFVGVFEESIGPIATGVGPGMKHADQNRDENEICRVIFDIDGAARIRTRSFRRTGLGAVQSIVEVPDAEVDVRGETKSRGDRRLSHVG